MNRRYDVTILVTGRVTAAPRFNVERRLAAFFEARVTTSSFSPQILAGSVRGPELAQPAMMEALRQFATSMTLVGGGANTSSPHHDCASETRFGHHLRRLRLSISGKQAWLSYAVGCSDAAISFWETGARLPTPRKMAALLSVLAAAGVSTVDLLDLRQRWNFERANRGLTLS
jgi:hypothetical protein